MKIKYFIYISAFFAAGLTTSGCEKYLTEVPQNKLRPSTTEDYDQLLNKAYITEQVMPYLDILSDDVELISTNQVSWGSSNGDAFIGAYMWSANHEQTMSSGDQAFGRLYQSILYTNIIIEEIDAATGMEVNVANVERTRKNIKGEAMALRAYSYFYLINLYAAPYNPATADNDPGVPINLTTSADDKVYRRNTVKQVYDQIVKDLTEGIRLMEENPVAKATKLKFNPIAAKAFLSRVYLYMQEWELAIDYASEVLQENSQIFNLHEAGERLTLENNIINVWDASVLWGTDYLGKNNPNVLFANGTSEVIPALSYWPYITTFSVNRELVETYETDDVRRLYFICSFQTTADLDVLEKLTYCKNRHINMFSAMYLDPGSGYSRVIRTEEMILIVAEAHARKSSPDIQAATGYLNDLREPKFKQGQYTPLAASDFDQQSILDYIALERQRELCFEGHRWFDLRRTTRPAMQRVGYENEVAQLEKDDLRYVLQIPVREISINPEIGLNPR